MSTRADLHMVYIGSMDFPGIIIIIIKKSENRLKWD